MFIHLFIDGWMDGVGGLVGWCVIIASLYEEGIWDGLMVGMESGMSEADVRIGDLGSRYIKLRY